MKKIIGALKLTKPELYTTSEQTACNYRVIEVPAGEYPIVMGKHYEGGSVMASVALPGRIVKSHFVDRLGSCSAMADTSSEIGEPYTYHLDYYQWTLAGMVAEGDERIVLKPEFTVKSEQYESGGKMRTMYHVVEALGC